MRRAWDRAQFGQRTKHNDRILGKPSAVRESSPNRHLWHFYVDERDRIEQAAVAERNPAVVRGARHLDLPFC